MKDGINVVTEKTERVHIGLTCIEIGGLWGVYQQESINTCFLSYFVHEWLEQPPLVTNRKKLLHSE